MNVTEQFNHKMEKTAAESTLKCALVLSGGPCGAEIQIDPDSYSGFSHVLQVDHGHKVDWLHWASPVPCAAGETESIFLECVICGKKGSENEAHTLISGHKFQARVAA
jgi:hypothetical protein